VHVSNRLSSPTHGVTASILLENRSGGSVSFWQRIPVQKKLLYISFFPLKIGSVTFFQVGELI
jgi:hypothetical protein